MLRKIRQILITGIVAVAAAQVAQAQEVERSLVGVWEVRITPLNCTTGEPIPNAAFEALYTFYKDGTMLVSFRNNTLALERTEAHGLWRRDLGWSEYSIKFVHIRRSVSTGLFAGKQESGGNVALSETGNEFTTIGYTIVYSTDGVPNNPSCSNSFGTRFTM